MLKGFQRQMIVVRTGNSRYFDGAYFILRREVDMMGEEQTDMLREANRIFEDGASRGEGRKKHPFLPPFLLGLLLGGGLALLLGVLL